MDRDGKMSAGVYAWTDVLGGITPAAFVPEGKTLPIDRVVDCREARAAKSGGRDLRYSVCVAWKQRCLFPDTEQRGYVEEGSHVREIPYHNGG